jgi:hypothetical protein
VSGVFPGALLTSNGRTGFCRVDGKAQEARLAGDEAFVGRQACECRSAAATRRRACGPGGGAAEYRRRGFRRWEAAAGPARCGGAAGARLRSAGRCRRRDDRRRGAGYRGGRRQTALAIAFDVDANVAEALADRYVAGDHPTVLDVTVHRPSVRATVDMNVDQLGLDADEAARATLTSLSLGSWDPGRDEVAKRNALASFIVRWYADGLA